MIIVVTIFFPLHSESLQAILKCNYPKEFLSLKPLFLKKETLSCCQTIHTSAGIYISIVHSRSTRSPNEIKRDLINNNFEATKVMATASKVQDVKQQPTKPLCLEINAGKIIP